MHHHGLAYIHLAGTRTEPPKQKARIFMNTHMRKLVLGFTIGLFAVSVGQKAWAQAKPTLTQGGSAAKVQAEGVASYYPGDAGRSHDEALEAALKAAVEQVSGVFMSTETQMKNFDLVKDEVESKTQGFVKKYTILKEAQDAELYRMTIEAEVEKAAFFKEVNSSLETLYKRVGMPSVMIVVKENVPGGDTDGEALSVTEKEIRRVLLMKGFRFIDFRSLPDSSVVENATAGGTIKRQDVMRVAKKAGAALVIFGSASTKSKGLVGQFTSIQATVSLDVMRSDSNQVIASETVSQPGVHIDATTAAVQALKKASEEILPKLVEQVSYLWVKEKNEGSIVELSIKEISFPHLMHLKKILGAGGTKGVKKVTQRSYANKEAILEVTTSKSAQDLGEAITELPFDVFEVEVEDVNANRVSLSIKPKAAPAPAHQ